jgi:hypothetical protein
MNRIHIQNCTVLLKTLSPIAALSLVELLNATPEIVATHFWPKLINEEELGVGKLRYTELSTQVIILYISYLP